MAGGTLGGNRGGPITGINITPMVDVMLVLLVILMVSANWIVQKHIKIELPKAKSGESGGADSNKPTTVFIAKDGGIRVNEDTVDDAGLKAKLLQLAQKDKEATVIVSADTEAHHGRVVLVMDEARAVGLRKFAVTVETKR